MCDVMNTTVDDDDVMRSDNQNDVNLNVDDVDNDVVVDDDQ